MSHTELSLMLLVIAILLSTAVAMGRIAKALTLPAVIGELLAGILLGPTVVGAFFPDLREQLLSSSSKVFHSMDTLVNLGGILLLFVIGLDIKLSQIVEQRKVISTVSLFGFVFPFGIGMISIFLFPDTWGYTGAGQSWALPLIVGTALSITSLPVISRILLDLGLLKTRFGAIIISSATLDDIVGWISFAMVASLFSPQLADISPWVTAAGVLVLVCFSLTGGRKLAARYLAAFDGKGDSNFTLLSTTLVILFVVTALMVEVGSHAMLGAFAVGLAFSVRGDHPMYVALRNVVVSFFAPLYFVFIGLRVDILQNFDLTLVLLVICIATLGKVSGVFLGARLAGVGKRESFALSLGMNSRGAVGIVLATSAYQATLINESVYVALLVMALVTTLVSGPLMKTVLNPDGDDSLKLVADVPPATRRMTP